MKGIIYKAQNNINGKVYIGKTTKSLQQRKSEHERFGKKLTYIQKALNKYGIENFTWTVLKQCETYEELNESEKYYINEFNSISEGYNLTQGGDGAAYGDLNPTKRPEIRLKLSKSFLGKHHSKETKEHLSKVMTGKKMSDEAKAKMSDSIKKLWLLRKSSKNDNCT